jgi:hypothetical protein
MTRPARLLIGALAALYLLWLATWIVFDSALYSPLRNYWDQTAVACVTAMAAFYRARRADKPYRGFLAMQGFAFLLMASAWLTYRASIDPSASTVSSLPDTSVGPLLPVSDAIYASSVFAMLCAWSYLTAERWHERPLMWLTTTVFAVLMVGLGMIFASFYYSEYVALLHTPSGRLSAVTAALEFATLAVSLLCMLLRLPSPMVWMLVGTVILLAGDMAFSVQAVPPIIETAWMFGQLLVLSSLVLMEAQVWDGGQNYEPPRQELSDSYRRSGISGILILVSLGAVLLSPFVWFLPVSSVWKSFCSALFIVSLVLVLVWITDRFDDAVSYLRSYVRRVHESRLVSEDWRGAPARIRAALSSTGLGTVLDTFRDSGARLKQDVLFLGPERLFDPPKDRTSRRNISCFIVMPFGQEWSVDVHRILASACDALNVRAVRGDDLFTPTDFLEDIWQGINAADFVIADISGRNPNVLYELGIAHTLAKPVLILAKQATDIPVDLATRRIILYGQSESDWREDLAQKISAAVAGIVRDYGLANRHE